MAIEWVIRGSNGVGQLECSQGCGCKEDDETGGSERDVSASLLSRLESDGEGLVKVEHDSYCILKQRSILVFLFDHNHRLLGQDVENLSGISVGKNNGCVPRVICCKYPAVV